MLSPSPAATAVVVDSRSRRRRRRSAGAAPPSAPAACSAPAAALASCLAALLLNTATGVDSSSASATANLRGGGAGGNLAAPCFLHAAATADGGRARHGTRNRGGGACGRAPVSRLSVTVASAGDSTGSGSSSSGFFPGRRRARSRLAAWGGSSEIGGAPSLGSGAGHEGAAAARGEGGLCRRGGSRRARRGVGSQGSTAQIQAGSGGGGGARAALTMEAAYAAAGLEGAGAADGPPGSTSLSDLAKMKLPELKEMYRAAGGKPGALRKAELVERLSESRQMGTVTTAPTPDAPAHALAPEPSLLGTEAKARSEAESSSSSLFSVLAESGHATADRAIGDGGDHHLVANHAAPEQDTRTVLPEPPVLAASAWSGEAAGVAGDVLSSGPSAVVAAARARGAAAAAASSRVAAGGRLRAMAEARRHTEAARSRASNTASPQNAAGDVQLQGQEQRRQQPQQPQQQHQQRVNGSGAAGRAQEARTGGVGSAGSNRGAKPVTGPGAAAVAAVAAAAAAAKAAAAVVATPGYATRDRSRGRDSRGGRQEGRHQGATQTATEGNGAGGGKGLRGSDGGAWSVLANPAVPRRSSHSPRQRRLPPVHNPWARGGVGGPAEGMPEEGDVVDAFLADTMMQSSEDREASGDPLFDREGRLGVYAAGAPMQLTFLGTASCIPSTSRGVSCTVLRNEGDLWLFDVGEGTQIQIQRSSLKPTRITKIFITHAHGDHSFGLPGLLCLMGTNFDRTEGNRVEIYGPTGLRAYLRAAIQYTYSKAVAPYVVHELVDVPFLHGDFSSQPEPFQVNIAQNTRYGEQNGGRNFYPNKDGHFELFQDQKLTVRAAPMKHGIPCVGFAVEEADRPGRLKVEELKPILQQHKQAITKATGKKDVGWMLGWIKSTKRGELVTIPGTDVTINSADYVGAPFKGRKVVILGDTCDAGSMVPLAMEADVVVHEATNTLLPPLDQGKTYASVEADAIKHGHSTPVMAAAFAQKVGAKTLILNHFSARYKGDPSDGSVAAMMRIERQAARAGGLERHQVMASWDLLELPVVDAHQWEANREVAREADAVFHAELLRRAEQWNQQQQQAEAPASGADSAPRRAYEHERSREFPDGVAPSDREGRGPVGVISSVTEPLDGRVSSSSSEGRESSAGTEQGDASVGTAAVPAPNTGLVGIMFDPVAK